MGESSHRIGRRIRSSVTRVALAVVLGGGASGAWGGDVQGDLVAEWINGSFGSWGDASRWSTNPLVPNNGEKTFDVVIRNADPYYPYIDVPGGVTVQNLTLDKSKVSSLVDLTVKGTIAMNASTVYVGTIHTSATVNAMGGISFSGGGCTLSQGTVNNGGLAYYGDASTYMELSEGAIFNNLSTGTFDIRYDHGVSWGMHDPKTVFNNAGTLRKSGGTGSSSIGVPFNNTGLVEVQSGTLRISGGGSGSGTFRVGAGSTLDLGYTLTDGAAITGPGNVSGALAVTGKATVASNLSLDYLNCSGELRILNEGSFLCWGSEARGAGIISSEAGSTLQINNSVGDWTINNAGTMTIPYYDLTGSDGVINNSGTLIARRLRTVKVPIHNSGTLEIQGSVFVSSLPAGGSNTGRIDVAAGAALGIGGTFAMGDGASITGLGSVTLSGPATVTGTVTVSGDLELGSQTRLNGATVKAVSGGTVTCSIGDPQASTGTLISEPGGTLVFRGSVPTSVPLTIDNSGTLSVPSGKVVSLTGPIVQLQGDTLTGGTWEVQSGSTLDFGGRSVAVNEGAIILRRSNARFKAIDQLVENRGQFTIVDGASYQPAGSFKNTGTLTINSTFTNNGTFQSTGSLGGAGRFVNAGGTADIGGTQRWTERGQLKADGGVVNLNSDAGSSDNYALTVWVDRYGAVANFNASQHLAKLDVDYGTAQMRRDGGLVLATKGLVIEGWGLLDLADNGMVVRAEAETRGQVLDSVTGWIKLGRPAPFEMRKGIISSVADEKPLTGLAAMLNDRGDGRPIVSMFRGEAVGVNDVLVGYSWNGDANLDGVIDASDYFLIDSGSITGKGGYRNGDFNYDGVVDAGDYFLIDSAFIGQSRVLSGDGYPGLTTAVPEPGVIWIVSVGVLWVRRRRVNGTDALAAD